jgi:hypothetical protein
MKAYATYERSTAVLSRNVNLAALKQVKNVVQSACDAADIRYSFSVDACFIN